jgi:V-type H+-transporting ATPase subunit a
LDDTSSEYVVQRVDPKCTYLFGADPVWGVTSNRLGMSNGVKMKVSVIFGVLHMMIGILHKYTNVIYLKHWAHLITECIGGTIILLSLFGWMDLIVF